MMNKKRVYIAGHRGMAGSAIYRQLAKRPDIELIIRNREQLDLLDTNSVNDFFAQKALMKFIWPPLKWVVLWPIIIIRQTLSMKI